MKLAASLLVALAAPAWAEIASVDTPQGLARVEDGRLLIGDRVALGGGADSDPFVWIEAREGTLLLVGTGTGGTACPAQWQWVHTAKGDTRVTEPFGTCAPEVEVSHDSETVTVTMPSGDGDFPRSAFVYDGKGAVREERLPQEPSGAPPEMGAEAWVGRYPFDLFRASDWRGPLVALMGADGYADGQAATEVGSPMAVDGDWVAGSGFNGNSGELAAVAINRGDGRLLVAVRGPDGSLRIWGDARGPVPAEVAGVLDPP